ncbi:restriction endonuclease [Poseidonibacter parvus]|uniref:Restriction endonuclease n=1 Tax=Poseidonibacter parvus TaxID=1850254 RepID=A0A1P8KQ86_9BACT|nr:restriction endonuclease [Poseidonibacter parvus]APW66726.1 restriction endonuclease [Poseidonibacter parvus]
MYLYEYQEVPEEISKTIIDNKSLHKYFKEDWGKVRTQQYCGILNIYNKDYFILPKISKQDENNLDIFIYMLMYCYDIKLENEQLASCQNHKHSFIEVFIQMFAQNLFKELQKGIYKEYTTQENNLTTLRGKYLINENLKYNFSKTKIYCEYDEFSMNNSLNQFFLYAIKILAKSVKDKKLLKQCELIFDEVEDKNFDINSLNIHFNRLNQRFKDSFEFALLLLNKYIPLFSLDKKSFAFLFDMNILFEKFIGKMSKEIEPNTKLQSCDTFEDLILKPDIIVNDLIIDTKYKKLSSEHKIKRDDKFQMYVYANNYKIKNTMLLYPKYKNEYDDELILGKNENKVNLRIKTVDLNYDDSSYSEYIRSIKIKLEKIYGS